MTDSNTNSSDKSQSWESWSKYVLKTLEKVEERVDYLEDQINQNNLKSQTDIVELKVKTAFVATIASILVSAIMSILAGLILNHMKDVPKTPTPKSTDAYYFNLKSLPEPKYYIERV